MNPFKLKEEDGGHLVPCGKCLACKTRRASCWGIRLMEQMKVSNEGHFVTLTYDTKYVPITNKGYMSLKKKDLQDFIKRLRQWHDENHGSIKYYAVGEYGGKTYRPHYHLILYNAKIEYIEKAWSECVNKKQQKYKRIGHIHYGKLEEASAAYTLKYISKAKRIPAHCNDDRIPEFALMSKGLGKNYLTERMINWHTADHVKRMYIPLKDGKKAPMPRYYKERIYTPLQKEEASYYYKQIADKEIEKQIAEYGENYQKVKEDRFHNGNRILNINANKNQIL